MTNLLKKIAAVLILSSAVSAKPLVVNGAFEGNNSVWKLDFYDTVKEGAAVLDFPKLSFNGTACARISVIEKQAEDWYIQLTIPEWTVKENSIYRFSMYGKGANTIQVSVSYGKDVPAPHIPYEYKEGFTFNLRDSWQKYSGDFSSNISGAGMLEVTINVGDHPGEYLLDSISIDEIDQIDQTNSWYLNADKRINEIRKGTVPLGSITDEKGKPVASGSAQIKLKKHLFPFGTSAIFADTVSAEDNRWYRNMICSLYNSITIESAFKWVDFEPLPNQLKSAEVKRYTDFSDSFDMELRGHVLAWALQQYGFETHWPQMGSDEQLKSAIKNRIIRDVTTYKGKIHEYDVWNEPFHEPDWFTRLNHLNSDKNNYWELLDSSFHWARSADSAADLYLNEYSIVEGGQTSTMTDIVRGMLARKVPITGIGAQCHFGNNPIEPEIIRKRLDSLDLLGVKIKLTEFDLGSPEEGVLLTEQEMASEYAKFLRTAFSHPAVDGITMWGFWDRLIWNKPVRDTVTGKWSQGSGLFKTDKTPKAAADSVINLLRKEWNTDTAVTVNSSAEIRGFYGDYAISVSYGDTLWEGSFSLRPGVPLKTITVKQITPVKNVKTEKKAQTFSAVTDSKGRVITISGLQAGLTAEIQIMSLNGRQVYQNSTESSGSAVFTIPQELTDGAYVVKIQHGSAQILQKLLLTR